MASAKRAAATASGPKGVAKEEPSIRCRFTFSDSEQPFEIDVLDLTTEEQVMVEEFFGKPWNQLAAEGWITASVKGKVFAAYLARRRKEPGFSYSDALGFEPTLKESEDADNDEAGAKRPTKGSRSGGSRS